MLIAPKPQAEEWKPVMGADVLFAPITRQMMRRARRAAMATMGKPDDGDSEGDATPAGEQIEELGDELSHAVLMDAIRDWKGVVVETEQDGESTTAELPCTPENKALVLSDPVYFDAFDAAHFVPFVLRERSKNAPAGSSDGISSRVTPAKITAAKSARAKRGVRNAHTPSKRSTTTR